MDRNNNIKMLNVLDRRELVFTGTAPLRIHLKGFLASYSTARVFAIGNNTKKVNFDYNTMRANVFA